MREEPSERVRAAEPGTRARTGLERPVFLSPLLGVQKRTAERSPAAEYAAVNKARDKRIARRKKNLKVILSGGYKQIPILKCP
jgi:hypothetical protein